MRVEPIRAISSIGKIKPIESVLSKPDNISFVDIIKSIPKVDRSIKIQKPINQMYINSYVLDITNKGMEYLKLYKMIFIQL